MKKHSTIIVEDEGPARRRLTAMVEQHSDLELLASLSNGSEAITAIPALRPELLLLDIELKDKTAFEVLEQVGDDFRGKVIFITAYDAYAVRAFEVEAIDYLLKPYDEERFRDAIRKVIRSPEAILGREILARLEESRAGTRGNIIIPEGSKDHIYRYDEIVYVQSDRYYAEVNTANEKRLIRITLKKLATMLPPNFLRISKSVILNTNYIVLIDHKKQVSRIKLKTKQEFYSSPTYQEELRRFFPRFG